MLGIVLMALAVSACASRQAVDGGTPGLSGNVTPGTAEDFSVNVGDRVFFTVDSTSLTSTARVTLERQAAWLKLYPDVRITVEGHADERGTREYNLALSARRAETTRSYLASLGVDMSRLRTISYGKERPVATCDAEQCWNQNRRAVTLVGG
jgi:peptidoglycan-associated lipoprotein